MGCLLAEFKLTAVLYRGRIEVTTAFWVAPLCTPPLNLSLSVFSLPLCLVSLFLMGEICTAFWIQVVSSLMDFEKFHRKRCSVR